MAATDSATEERKEYHRQYNLKNKEKLNAQCREYYQKNKEILRGKAKQYGIDNKESISKKKKVYHLANRKRELVRNELNKCVALCANCHRKLHHEGEL